MRCLSLRLPTKSSWGFLCAPRKTNGNASVQEERRLDLASPRPLHPSGALNEVAMVVAAMHSAVLVAEKSDVVSTAERTLNQPGWITQGEPPPVPATGDGPPWYPQLRACAVVPHLTKPHRCWQQRTRVTPSQK